MVRIGIKSKGKKALNYCCPFLILFLIFSSTILAGNTQNDNGQNTDKEISIEFIDETVLSLNKTIDDITNTQTDNLAREIGAKSDQIEKKIQTLNALMSAYNRLKNAILGLKKSKNEQLTIEHMYEDYRTKGITNKPPYSLTFHDSIQAEISAVTRNKKNIELTIEILKKNSADSQNSLSEKEKELRQLKEKIGGNLETQTVQDRLELEIKELSIQYLRTMIRTLGLEINRFEIENSNAGIKIRMLKEQELFVGANIYHDKEDLNHQLELIQNKEAIIQNEITRFQNDQGPVERAWGKAQEELNSARLEQERKIAQAFLKARDEWRKTYVVALELKQDSLRLFDRQKIIWQQRYASVKDDLPYNEKKQVKDDAEKNLTSLNQTLQIQQNYLVNLQKQASAIENLIQEEGTPLSIKTHLGVEKDALLRQFERRLEFQSILIATDQMERNLVAQMEKQLGQPSVKEHFSGVGLFIKKMWDTEIWVVDEHSVSVGKVFAALIILVFGIVFVRFVLHLVHMRILIPSQFKETTASAVHKVLSYFAYLLVFLFALRMVNIPLTAFAFLGGAIAIGVGFGAQNLINNFISGFIILGEQPINIGDLIEVDGLLGKVEEIGARCTRVRTGENVHKLVPNSSFLEKNITNWTLSDNKIRTKISLGVAYGSNVKKVQDALLLAAKSNPRILKNPEPFVLFSDFGDNALVFELYFWVMVRMVLEKKQVESQVRFEIDSVFSHEGIVIAFPQRDIHFDTDNPLRIQWTGQKTSGSTMPTSTSQV